ncbi:MAG: hypothetical protein EAZ61_06425 [Oscillatoriales cyanobacterium]|nr:MAG: hypothetical protein EAZ61_06425 [Oscillatoriales cyanobacterium]
MAHCSDRLGTQELSIPFPQTSDSFRLKLTAACGVVPSRNDCIAEILDEITASQPVASPRVAGTMEFQSLDRKLRDISEILD